ncbi:MAG: zinc-dependent metalloprotease [Gemmatimonadetes bacterium]|nr:zinc-dependent metalloprotease [Gemmatimonadota bacterium]
MRRMASHVLVLAATTAMIALPTGTAAQDTVAVAVEEEKEEEEVQEENPFRDFERLVEGAEVWPGFFDLYTKEGRLYLAVPADRLGQEFLMDMRVAQGIGAAGLFAGTTLSTFEMDLMAFEKHGENVLLVQRPHRFGAASDVRAAAAVSVSVGSSVVRSTDVEAIRPDSALVLDVTSWFLSDLSGVGELTRGAARGSNGQSGSTSFDRSRSYIDGVSSFPENTNIRAMLTFRSGRPGGVPSVADGRYIPVTIHYTLAKLPERPMERRIADDRVGNFMTVHKDFSSLDSTFFRRYVNRWRLEPGERVGDLRRPVEPITYYIDRTVPDEYRGWFKEAVENWNTAFEAAGWVDAIRALDLPEDADPNDIRYSVLRWNTSDDPGYGAIGPSKVDPRTGEILVADILFEANGFRGFRNTWRNIVNPVTAAEAFEMALGVGEFQAPDPNLPGMELPGFGSALEAQGALAGLVLAARGELDPGDPLPDELLRQYTIWLVMHEVGHTLGLRHNFRSSASTPLDRLHNTEFTGRNGVYSSVMEYPTINLARPGERNGDYYTYNAGSYDRWAISYAYTQSQDDANDIARRVSELGHMYGTDSDARGALDPTITRYDLGGDPLLWGAERTALIRDLLPKIPEYVLRDNSPFVEATNAYTQLMNEYARALAPAVKYIGGQYMNRDHVGDGRDPFVHIPKAKQLEALDLLVDRIFAEGALGLPPAVLQSFGANGYEHWGSTRTNSGRYDYPFHARTLELQSTVLNQILNASRLARIRDGETKFGTDQVATIPEIMASLTTAIWSELGTGTISADRRDLQRTYLDSMERLVVNPANGTPADARAVARWELVQLRDRIDSALSGASDVYTQAHLFEALARIDKTLDAGLEAERD